MFFFNITGGVIAAILLLVVIQYRRENKSMTEQIKQIRSHDTNSLIVSETGLADKELLNEINSLLSQLRDERVLYNRKSHALEQMMTNISHDLRTPLTSALGYISLAQAENIDPEERKREFSIIERRMKRLEELIDQFFEFYKVISKGETPELEHTNLVGILEESISHYYDDYSDRGRMIEFDCKQSRIMLSTNRGMLMRVFDNLITNALKHGKGSLRISVVDDRRLVFTNKTDDADIDAEHVFDEFYTTDLSRTSGSTGLGLAIAKQFVELLGGNISAKLTNGEFAVTVIL